MPISNIARAQACGEFSTVTLISHASKNSFAFDKRRITLIIERRHGESQMSFRKGKGTTDAIFQLRQIGDKTFQM